MYFLCVVRYHNIYGHVWNIAHKKWHAHKQLYVKQKVHIAKHEYVILYALYCVLRIYDHWEIYINIRLCKMTIYTLNKVDFYWVFVFSSNLFTHGFMSSEGYRQTLIIHMSPPCTCPFFPWWFSFLFCVLNFFLMTIIVIMEFAIYWFPQ